MTVPGRGPQSPTGRLDPAQEPIGLLYTWWKNDPLPELPPLSGFSATPTDDAQLITRLVEMDAGEVSSRLAKGNQPYLALLDGEPVGYGWSGSHEASVDSLGVQFDIPPGNRYLWDFVTLPAWRGRGIYPHLLQGILRGEMGEAGRFWIGHDSPNVASRRGILKAGFTQVATAHLTEAGQLVIVEAGPRDRARSGAELFGAPFLERSVLEDR